MLKHREPLRVGNGQKQATRAKVEGWMLYPGNDSQSKALRWAHELDTRMSAWEKVLIAMKSSTPGSESEVNYFPIGDTQEIEIKPAKIPDSVEFVTVPYSDLYSLVHRPYPDSNSQQLAKEKAANGLAAGALLYLLYEMEQLGIKSLSFTKALRVARKYYHECDLIGEKSGEQPRKYSRDALDDLWKEYRTVSHLWAAIHAIRGFDLRPPTDLFASIPIRDLLKVAIAYSEWAEKFFMHWSWSNQGRFEFIRAEYLDDSKRLGSSKESLQKPDFAALISGVLDPRVAKKWKKSSGVFDLAKRTIDPTVQKLIQNTFPTGR